MFAISKMDELKIYYNVYILILCFNIFLNKYSGYAQLTNTFVVVGGHGPDGQLDTVLKFNPKTYEWDLFDQ